MDTARRKEIQDILNNIGKKRTSDLSQEESMAIYEASRSNDAELQNRSLEVVHECLLSFEAYIMAGFGIKPSNQNFEDCKQSMALVIVEKLRNWDPSIATLSTYFGPDFRQVCVLQRRDQRAGTSSRYYENMSTHVNKAMDCLRKETGHEPTTQEIVAYISMQYKEDVAPLTVDKIRNMDQDSMSLDAAPQWMLPNAIVGDPEAEILRKEKMADVARTIQSMEPFHRRIIEIIYEIYKKGIQDRRITNTDLADVYNERYQQHVTPEWMKLMRNSAERDFMAKFERGTYQERIPIQDIDAMRKHADEEDEDVLCNEGAIFIHSISDTVGFRPRMSAQ